MKSEMDLSDLYITRDGRVFFDGIEKPQHAHSRGYKRISFNNTEYSVHRLVAMMYIPNPENKKQINHKDGNKTNNHYSNLEWVTNYENHLHAVELGLWVYNHPYKYKKTYNNNERL